MAHVLRARSSFSFPSRPTHAERDGLSLSPLARTHRRSGTITRIYFLLDDNAALSVPRTNPSRIIKSVIARYVFSAFLRAALAVGHGQIVAMVSRLVQEPFFSRGPGGRVNVGR